MTKSVKSPHPGKILDSEYLQPFDLSQNQLAQAIGVPSNRINEIVRGRRGITADTDLRLARFYNVSEGYWLNLQNAHDMAEAKREQGKSIEKIRPYDQKSKS